MFNRNNPYVIEVLAAEGQTYHTRMAIKETFSIQSLLNYENKEKYHQRQRYKS